MSETADRALRLLHRRKAALAKGDPTAPPITPAATFHLPGDTQAPFTYGRFANPGIAETEAALAILEDAPCLLFPSGMAAIAAVFHSVLKAGDRVLFPADGYYTGRKLLDGFLAKFGVTPDYVPTRAIGQTDLAPYSLVFLETPSNPGLDVCDIAQIAARKGAARLAVDNTTATMLVQRPLDLGADIVVAADTKAPNGHADLLAGHVATRDPGLMAALHDWRTLSGAIPSPFDAWALHRGLETFELRLARMTQTAAMLAERLSGHPALQALRYPFLAGDPSGPIARRQMQAGGSILTLTLADAACAERFIAAAPLAPTTSFGSTHSSAERRARWGDAVPEGFVRLSVGCEPPEALWQGIATALEGF
ncbi:MAG: cystathionine gamma-lyase [Pseudomonadota bacterium]